MNAAAIDYVWKAIQESERSDDLAFLDALARRMPPARSAAPGREPVTVIAAYPLPTNSGPLPTGTLASV